MRLKVIKINYLWTSSHFILMDLSFYFTMCSLRFYWSSFKSIRMAFYCCCLVRIINACLHFYEPNAMFLRVVWELAKKPKKKLKKCYNNIDNAILNFSMKICCTATHTFIHSLNKLIRRYFSIVVATTIANDIVNKTVNNGEEMDNNR